MSEFLDRNFSSIDPDQNFYNNILGNGECEYYSILDYNNVFGNGLFSTSFTLFSYNIRSFHSNGDSLEALLESMNLKPNLLVLSETWNKSKNINMCLLDNYLGYHEYRDGDERGGGVSIFCDHKLNSSKVVKFSLIESYLESCCVKVQLMNDQYIIILGLYRPPTESIPHFIEKLDYILNDIVFRNASLVIIAGDLNININDSDSFVVNNYLNFLSSLFYLPLITKPTRFSSDIVNSNPTVIDHIFINKPISHKSGIINYDSTDHLPTFSHMNLTENFESKHDKIKIKFRPYSQQNFNSYFQKLNSIDWSFLDVLNPNSAVEQFLDKLNSNYCASFPLKIKIIPKNVSKKPWFTRELKALVRQKSEYFKLYRLGIISKQTNNIFKNRVNKAVRKAKDLFHLNKFNFTLNDKAGCWKMIGELMGQPPKNGTVDELIINGTSFKSPIEIADKFNEYFSEIALKLESEIPASTIEPLSYLPSENPIFRFCPITEEECTRVAMNLKNTKNNINFLPVRTFKGILPTVIRPLTRLINKCFSYGVFPNCFKIARITQIFKSGSPTDPSNYRPISTLPFLSKIFETCLCRRLESFFEENSLLTCAQYGFRKNLSTSDALIKLTNSIYSSLNSKKHHIDISIDYKKAFDTISHSILLKKNRKIRCEGQLFAVARKLFIWQKTICGFGWSFLLGKGI